MNRIIRDLCVLTVWITSLSMPHASAISGTYTFSSALLNHRPFDTRRPLELYSNLQNLRSNWQVSMLKKIDLANTGNRYMYYFTNLIVDNVLLETIFIGTFHEPRHAEIAYLYGAKNIRVEHFSMSYSGSGLTRAQHAHISGTGINLQTKIASEDYIRQLLSRKSSPLTRSTYISNKMTGFVYVSCLNFGDPVNYIYEMANQGILITKSELGAYYT